jgi:hypothetical protein
MASQYVRQSRTWVDGTTPGGIPVALVDVEVGNVELVLDDVDRHAALGAPLDVEPFLRSEIWLVVSGHDPMVRRGRAAHFGPKRHLLRRWRQAHQWLVAVNREWMRERLESFKVLCGAFETAAPQRFAKYSSPE